MANPTRYQRDYSFSDFQANNPTQPLPGPRVDDELENIERTTNETIDALLDIRRSDGALRNGIVTLDSLAEDTRLLMKVDAEYAGQIATVAGIADDVTTVAGIADEVTTVSANVSDVTNFADVYLGPKAADPSERNNGQPLRQGDLYFNTAAGEMRTFAGTAWHPVGDATPIWVPHVLTPEQQAQARENIGANDASKLTTGEIPNARLPLRLRADVNLTLAPDANEVTESGWYRIPSGGGVNFPSETESGDTLFHIHVNATSGGNATQLVIARRTGRLFFRGMRNGAWTPWHEAGAGAGAAFEVESDAAAQAATIPASLNYLRIIGTGALYERTANEPPHAGKLKSADGAWWQIVLDGGYVRPAWFGDGIEGLKKAWSVSKRVSLTAGAEYVFNGPGDSLYAAAEDVHIQGNGARIRVLTGDYVIACGGGYDDVQRISAVPITDAGAYPAVSIPVPDGTKYQRGDVIFIRSEQGLPSFNIRRRGEFFVVHDSDAGSVKVAQPLRYTYSGPSGNNVRIGRLRRSNIRIQDLFFEFDGSRVGAPVAPNAPFIYIESALNPVVENVHCGYANADFVYFRNCYGWLARDVHVLYQRNSDNDWHDGGSPYALRVANCAGGTADRGTYGHGRHAVDFLCLDSSGPGQTKIGEALAGAGGCYDNRVLNWYGQGGSNGPFSSHDGTEDIEWMNCKAVQARNVGFQFRGRRHRAINCGTDSCPIGFRTFIQSGYESSADSDGSEFVGCWAINPRTTMFEFMAGTAQHRIVGAEVILDDITRIPARVVHVRSEQPRGLLIDGLVVTDAGTNIGDTGWHALATIVEYAGIAENQTAHLSLSGLRISTFNNSGVGLQSIVRANGGTLKVTLSDCEAETYRGQGVTVPAIVDGTSALHPRSQLAAFSISPTQMQRILFGHPDSPVDILSLGMPLAGFGDPLVDE